MPPDKTLVYFTVNNDTSVRYGVPLMDYVNRQMISGGCVFATLKAVEKEYYKHNARTLLTLWGERGQSLNDYANRSLAGLTDGYYKPRWEMFITEVCRAVEEGRPFDE